MTDNTFKMIVDTSALVAVATREEGYRLLAHAIYSNSCLIPEPVRLEFMLVMSGRKSVSLDDAKLFLDDVLNATGEAISFKAASSDAAIAAISSYGKGNGRGGTLNMLDLMVYGAAKETGLPILCTGKDFASTDALIHPASRVG